MQASLQCAAGHIAFYLTKGGCKGPPWQTEASGEDAEASGEDAFLEGPMSVQELLLRYI